jgi:hypothetical protein
MSEIAEYTAGALVKAAYGTGNVVIKRDHDSYVKRYKTTLEGQRETLAAQAKRIKALEAVNSQKFLDENKRLKSLLSETRGHLQRRKMSMLASTPERLLEKIEAAMKETNNATN